MKKFVLSLVAFALLFSVGTANAKLKKAKPNPPYALSRGFSNLMLGWLEIPRGIIYENSRIPIVGFVTGPLKGSLLTTWRVLAGTVDIVGLGLTREGLYCGQLPDFVWDAPWISACGEDVVSPPYASTNPCEMKCKVKCQKFIKKQCLKGGKKQWKKGRKPFKKKCDKPCKKQKEWKCK